MCGTDIFLGLIAIIFPPLAVWVKRGLCSADSLINIALCCLGFLPGLLHAWYIIAVTPDPTYEEVPDEERGNVNYYFVQGQPQYVPRGGRPHGSQRPAQQGYGTVNNTPSAQFPGAQDGFVKPAASAPAQQEGSSSQPPPPYSEAVRGDNKVQHP